MADIMPPQDVRPQVDIPTVESPVRSVEAVGAPQPKDLLIVFGQGPVKPLFRREDFNSEIEADAQRLEQWDKFKKDPLHSNEPDFRILEGEQARSLMPLDPNQADSKRIELEKQGLSLEEVEARMGKLLKGPTSEEIETRMIELQNQGRFGLNRWGRQNGIMAGFAVLSGHSEKALLTGGRTIPDWAKEKLSPARMEAWPSEAQLMRDIIVRRFGRLYQEKYGRPIEDAILTEDRSKNTLENFANAINLNPQVLESGVASGLGSDFHVPRTERIGFLFTGDETFQSESAQALQQSRLDAVNQRREGINVTNTKTGEVKPAGSKDSYQEILDWMNSPENEELAKKASNETEFDEALQDPGYLTYWIGFIGIVEDPRVLQRTVQRLSSDQRYSESATEVFSRAGLDFTKISNTDLTGMPKEEFDDLREKLRVIMTKRRMPGQHVETARVV